MEIRMDYSEWDKQDWFLPTQAAYLWCGIHPLFDEERRCIDDVIEAMIRAIEDDRLYAYTDPDGSGKLVQGKIAKNDVDSVILHRSDLVSWSKLVKYPTPFLDPELRKAMKPPKECADRISVLETELKQCRRDSKLWYSAKKRLTDRNTNLSDQVRLLKEHIDENNTTMRDLRNMIKQLQRDKEQLQAENERLNNKVANLEDRSKELTKKSKDTGLPHCLRHRVMLKAALYVLHNQDLRKEYLERAKGRTESINCAALAKTMTEHGHILELKDETGWSENAIMDLLREAVREKEQTTDESATTEPAENPL
jgi:DNA repair exonuclease SbcCD ATPase subunit